MLNKIPFVYILNVQLQLKYDECFLASFCQHANTLFHRDCWIHLQTFYALHVKKVMSVCFAFGLSRFNVTDGDSGMKGMRDKDSAEDAVVRPNRTEESRGQSLLHLHRKESVGLMDWGY